MVVNFREYFGTFKIPSRGHMIYQYENPGYVYDIDSAHLLVAKFRRWSDGIRLNARYNKPA